MTLSAKTHNFHTEVFKVLRTCRQMAKFANEKRRFGDVTLHAKFKHVATQFAHRGITHGERTAQKAFFKRK